MDVYNEMGGCGQKYNDVPYLFMTFYRENNDFDTYQDCVDKCRGDPLCLKVQWDIEGQQCYGEFFFILTCN